MIQLTCFFVIFIACILCNSNLSFQYAAQGLTLWFERMIPVLFPFMILSGIMVRLELTGKIATLLKPFLSPLYRVRENVIYAIFMGFLCGFPMGAKVVSELYTGKYITKREADFLLSFCNNIGPVYFCSFVLPLLERKMVLPYLFGMYGIPLLYGMALRYTVFRDLDKLYRTNPQEINSSKQSALQFSGKTTSKKMLFPLLEAIDDSIHTSIQSILALGGYMILFNTLNLLPRLCGGEKYILFAPLLEISGGLLLLGNQLPLYSLLVLSFGGLSCLAQSYHCIRGTDLSMSQYTLHKIILTLLNGMFYLGWFLLWPETFLG